MKQLILFTVAIIASVFTSCSNDSDELTSNTQETVEFKFNVGGDFNITTTPMTRSLSADGKDLTDLWVLDYMNNTLVQQLHQVSTDDNFGTPTMNLKIGSHHIYFIASRGTNPTLDLERYIISWEKVSDSFFKDYSVDVVATTNGDRTVELNRIVTKVKLFITDALPEDAGTVHIAPKKWYYGWNYLTGAPTVEEESKVLSYNIPSEYIGNTNFSASMFGFSGTEEWNTDVTFFVKRTTGSFLGKTTIENVPFKANRSSELSGPLFGSNGAMTLTLNDVWTDAYSTTW